MFLKKAQHRLSLGALLQLIIVITMSFLIFNPLYAAFSSGSGAERALELSKISILMNTVSDPNKNLLLDSIVMKLERNSIIVGFDKDSKESVERIFTIFLRGGPAAGVAAPRPLIVSKPNSCGNTTSCVCYCTKPEVDSQGRAQCSSIDCRSVKSLSHNVRLLDGGFIFIKEVEISGQKTSTYKSNERFVLRAQNLGLHNNEVVLTVCGKLNEEGKCASDEQYKANIEAFKKSDIIKLHPQCESLKICANYKDSSSCLENVCEIENCTTYFSRGSFNKCDICPQNPSCSSIVDKTTCEKDNICGINCLWAKESCQPKEREACDSVASCDNYKRFDSCLKNSCKLSQDCVPFFDQDKFLSCGSCPTSPTCSLIIDEDVCKANSCGLNCVWEKDICKTAVPIS